MNKKEYNKVKSKYLKAAKKSVKKYIQENQLVLREYFTSLIQCLKEENIEKVKLSSYELFTIGKSFEREDLTRIGEIIYKSVQNDKFASNSKLLLVFHEVLMELQKTNTHNKAIEELLTIKIYSALREANKNL